MKVTKTDVNEISVNLFKKYHMFLLPSLCDIINLCLLTGIFPDCLKIAIVIPIFKKGQASDVSNYRPIALLPFLSKIIERCIFDRLSNYASSCNLIAPTQFGFMKGKSTHDAITLITENIYEAFNMGNGFLTSISLLISKRPLIPLITQYYWINFSYMVSGVLFTIWSEIISLIVFNLYV